jgi:hypothetical protein
MNLFRFRGNNGIEVSLLLHEAGCSTSLYELHRMKMTTVRPDEMRGKDDENVMYE